MNALRWSVLAGVLALAAVMRDPVYFVVAKIDLAGGSTGWHRAQLIHSSIAHLDEWWITGTERKTPTSPTTTCKWGCGAACR